MGEVGRVTKTGSAPGQPAPTGAQNTATVRKGENSLADVSKRTGVSEESLKQINPQIKDPNKLSAGQEVKLPTAMPAKSAAATKENKSPIKLPDADARALTNEHSFAGTLMQAKLYQVVPKPTNVETLPKSGPEILIDRHTHAWALDENGLGKELAESMKRDPSAAKTADEVLERVGDHNKDDVALEISKNLTHDDLKKLASTPEGQKLLDHMGGEMSTGLVDLDERAQANRLETAKTAVALEADPRFQTLSPTGQRQVLSALEKNETKPQTPKNIVDLVTTEGFDQLSDATQKEMLDAMEKKGADTEFVYRLKRLANEGEFRNLNDGARANVIKDLTKFTETESYKGMSEAQKGDSLMVISTLSVHAEANPSFTTARNTLNHLVNGSVKMAIYYKANANDYGSAENGVMRFNAENRTLFTTNRENLVTTAAHELNHALNGPTEPGTPERFLSEYGAFYMERSALGQNPPNVDHMRGVLKSLATDVPAGTPYDPLRELYKSNPDFQKVVDDMVAGLNATPPVITNPENLRLKLQALSGGATSKYLNTPSNMDNHWMPLGSQGRYTGNIGVE